MDGFGVVDSSEVESTDFSGWKPAGQSRISQSPG